MKIFDYLTYMLIWFFIKILGKVPVKVAVKLGYILGDIVYCLDVRHRKVALENLQYAYGNKLGGKGRSDFIKRIYRNLCQFIFDISWLIGANSKEIDERIQIHGSSNLIKAFSRGKGVLIISAHIGAWELLPYIFARMGVVVNIIYRPLDFKPMNRFIEEFRSMFGGRLIPTKDAMQKINKALGKGEAVGLLIDQSADWYNGVWVDFFGHRTCTSHGAARIALTNKVPVIPVFIFREGLGFKVIVRRTVPLDNTGDLYNDIEVNTLNYTKVIEKEIRKYPEQWFWVHRRWKNKAYSLLSSEIRP